MKSLLFFTLFSWLTAFSVNAQTIKNPFEPIVKSASTVPPPRPLSSPGIPAAEWDELIKALAEENWNKSSQLASAALRKLRTDNESRQLARLRYFYVYSLAGKIAQKTMSAAELERISQAFVGQDFLMPSREILADCTGRVNYVCAVQADKTSVRVTATNKSASAVTAFEYVKLPEKFDFSANDGKQVFLGGKLKKLEIGTYRDEIRIVKLMFENGFADVVK